MVSSQGNQQPKNPALWRRLLKVLGRLFLVLVVLVLLLGLLFSLPVTRKGILKIALGQAHRFLPGELTCDEAQWSRLGRFEFRDLVWRVSAADSLPQAAVGDTLAHIPELVLDLDLSALRDHDLVANEILVAVGRVHLPLILSLFPVQENTPVSTDSLQTIPFLRDGGLPLIPSLAVKTLELGARNVTVNDSLEIKDVGLSGVLEMRAGKEPTIRLKGGRVHLVQLQEEPFVLAVDSLGLDLKANASEREFVLAGLSLRVSTAGPPVILETWRQASAVTLRLQGAGHWTANGLDGNMVADVALPGFDHLRPLLPSDFPPGFAGPLQGVLQVEASIDDLSAPMPEGRVRADFGATDWLDRLRLDLSVQQGRATIDTLDFLALGARVAVSGFLDSTLVDLNLAAGLEDPALLRLFGGEELADVEAGAELEARIRGPWPLPDVDLELNAFARTANLAVPSFHGTVTTADRQLVAQINLAQGMSTGAVELDSLRLHWAGDLSRPDSLTHRFDLGVWSPMGRLGLGGTGLIDSVRTIVLDSLVVVSMDSTMRTSQPVTFTQGPGPRDFKVEGLRLAGGLGFLAMNGNLDDSGLALQVETDLLLDEEFLTVVAPNELWSRDGGADLSLKATLDLEGGTGGPVFTGQAGALVLPHREGPQLGAALNFHLVSGDSSGLGADLMIHADEVPLVRGNFLWPGRPDLESGKWVPDPGRGLKVEFPRQEFDLALLNQVLPADVSLTGIMDFGATMEESETGESNDGRLDAAKIDGHLETQNLDVRLPNRSRIALNIETELSGTLADPRIEGRIEVVSGFFRIPELPRSLLPVEGESLLWQAMAQQAAAQGDSTGIPVLPDSRNQGPILSEAKPLLIPDLDVKVEIPGNLIVNGYGLNIELDGDLQITRGQDAEGVPAAVIKGRAGVLQGTAKFMNNVFEVEKADIRFNQKAPPNPHIDVRLSADVSGYILHLEVSGFADDPLVELTSEPDMNEADIMAVLLFGQPANDLDSDQRGRANEENDPATQMRENLAAMAVMFGGAGIQNKMSTTLGVDMVEMGSGTQGDSTIMVGKFITPKILLKYNQSLEIGGTYFMTLEYTLSKYFKFLSTYGQGEEASGLELKWTRRY